MRALANFTSFHSNEGESENEGGGEILSLELCGILDIFLKNGLLHPL
jgi:hypothetical protein